jgi:hypothetical protein
LLVIKAGTLQVVEVEISNAKKVRKKRIRG